ncbi:MAG: hypothetical protein J6Y78_15585 [Paludibacteraceae bacterium]|nr:hypothetical protein [Paludibacteraceae bacterium]
MRHWTDSTKIERFKLGINAEYFAVFYTQHFYDFGTHEYATKFIPKFFEYEEDAWEFYRGRGGHPGIRDFDETAKPPVPVVNGEPLFPDVFDYTKVKGGEQLCMLRDN